MQAKLQRGDKINIKCYFSPRYNGFVIHQLIKNVDKVLMTPFELILFTLIPGLPSFSIQTHAMTFVYLFVSLHSR